MRALLVCLASAACLIGTSAATASASPLEPSPLKHVRPSAQTGPSGCKRTSYTGDGGYYSQGNFYWEPNDKATLRTKWCYSNGVITSYSVTYTSTIPSRLNPDISTSESPR